MILIARSLALLATLLFAAQTVAAQGMSASGTVMTICSPDGTRDIVLDANGEPVEATSNHCLKCFIVAIGLPPEPTSLLLPNGTSTPQPAQTSDIHHAHLATGFAARAPPHA